MLNFKTKIKKEVSGELECYVGDLQTFFKIRPDSINIHILSNRKSFEESINRQDTPDWLVGYTKNNEVFVLASEALENESNHKKDEFLEILKHEICHVFVYNINPECVSYFSEGLSLNFAGQDRTAEIKKENFELFFGSSNYYNLLDNNQFLAKHGYQLSYMAVKNMLKRFNRDQLLDLLKIKKTDKHWQVKIKEITGLNNESYNELLSQDIIIK